MKQAQAKWHERSHLGSSAETFGGRLINLSSASASRHDASQTKLISHFRHSLRYEASREAGNGREGVVREQSFALNGPEFSGEET